MQYIFIAGEKTEAKRFEFAEGCLTPWTAHVNNQKILCESEKKGHIITYAF